VRFNTKVDRGKLALLAVSLLFAFGVGELMLRAFRPCDGPSTSMMVSSLHYAQDLFAAIRHIPN